jgi:integrase
MARDWTVREVESCRVPGAHRVSRNLYLEVSASGAKSWTMRYILHGSAHWMGLGSIELVPMHDAREAVTDARRLLRKGVDPLQHKRLNGSARGSGEAKNFEWCAEEYIKGKAPGWSGRTAEKWRNILELYAYPAIGKMLPAAITTEHILKILTPIWSEKPQTADTLRNRIERVLDYAKANKLRDGENPARWMGHLKMMLAAPRAIQPIVPRKALPYAEMAAFMTALRRQREADACARQSDHRTRRLGGVEGQLLEFQILTAVRPKEAAQARWEDIDEAERLWKIPAEIMKGRVDHWVPLSDRALELLGEVTSEHAGYVFKGLVAGKPISAAGTPDLLDRMGYKDRVDAHGFRSAFRDWGAEETNYPSDILEMALAHKIKNKTEAAYRRGKLLKKRRDVMNDWAAYCAPAL